MQKKATEMAMEKKTSKATTAKTKGITPDLSQSNSDSSKHIENIARVCGLNLGKEEWYGMTRDRWISIDGLAELSLIQEGTSEESHKWDKVRQAAIVSLYCIF